MEVIDQYHFIAFIVGAVATTGAMIIALLNYWKTHLQNAKSTLSIEIEKLRNNGALTDAGVVIDKVKGARDGELSLVISDISLRHLAGYTLARLGDAAHMVNSPVAWHLVLRGGEYATLTRFLADCSTLVWNIRTTTLELEGDARFYNGNKQQAASDIYRALNVTLSNVYPYRRSYYPLYRWYRQY